MRVKFILHSQSSIISWSASAGPSKVLPAKSRERSSGCAHSRASSDLHAEDCDDADVGWLAQLHRDQTVGLRVPEGARGRCNRCAIVLLDNARYDVLELFVEFGEILDAGFDDLLTPLVYLFSLVLNLVGTNDVVHGFFGNLLNVLRRELQLILEISHVSPTLLLLI